MKSLVSFLCAFIYCSVLCSQIFVNQEATGNNDGSSWDNAFINLQDALDSAEAGDQIWVAQGIYVPVGSTPDSSNFLVHTPVQLYGGFIGDETSLDQRNWESNVSLISGDTNGDDIAGNPSINREDNAFHVLTINAEAGNTIVDGFQFQGGMTRSDDPVSGQDFRPWRGGAMYISSSAVIANCVFEDNFAYQGAAIHARALDPVGKILRIENSVFHANVMNLSGAAYVTYFETAELIGCTFENNLSGSTAGGVSIGNVKGLIENCSFVGNNASTGGGLFLWQNINSPVDSSIIEVTNSQFTGNVAVNGGGIRINNFHEPVWYIIDSCEFINNIATGEGGGFGVYSGSSTGSNANVKLTNNSFIENLAIVAGGAISCYPNRDTILFSVDKSNFTSNEAPTGGAIVGYNAYSGSYFQAAINQCTFTGNVASIDGGAIAYYNRSTVYDLQYSIDSSLFIDNTAVSYGGALSTIGFSGTDILKGTISNSIFQDNFGADTGGAISSVLEDLYIENCEFTGNDTDGAYSGYEGGGAIVLDFCPSVNILNSSFIGNNSDVDGSAILNVQSDRVRGEGLLFQNNTGGSVIRNDSQFELVNVTMYGNDNGIQMEDASSLFIQNSILHNNENNLISGGAFELVSGGSNISNDMTTVDFLRGNGNYSDMHDMDLMLDDQLVPQNGSLCVDRGNPNGVMLTTDLNGEDRLQGQQIDIGCYESPFLSSSGNIIWESSSLQVSPNPVSDVLNLNLYDLEPGEWQIQLYSFDGRLISVDRLFNSGGSFNYQTNTNNLNQGNYYVIVGRDGQIYGSKFIKVGN